MGPTPLIEKPRKHRLIYSGREQSRGCLRAGRGGGLQRGRRKLIEGHVRYFHRSGGSSGTCENSSNCACGTSVISPQSCHTHNRDGSHGEQSPEGTEGQGVGESWLNVRSVVPNSLRPYRLQPARICCPWDSPGKKRVAMPSSRASFQPREQTHVSFTTSTSWEAQMGPAEMARGPHQTSHAVGKG